VTKGWFKITTVDSQGGELILNQCGPGEAIGEMSLIDEEPRSASVIALSAAEVLKLSREDFLTVLTAYPSLAQLMMRKLSARMRFSTTYIEKAIEFAKHIADGDYNFVKSQIQSSQSNIIEEGASNDARATEMLTAFFRMVEGVQKREEDLQQQVRQLTIQIDHAKRQEEFEKTTGSDFFADLKAQAAKLREERDQDE
jgi:CRP-like cAMP-binding protein